MQYRSFGRVGGEVSALGFGLMRLPVLNQDNAQIDEEEAIRMIRHAIDHGVNYVDSAHIYHGGNADALIGKALRDGYRNRVKVATKLTTWQIKQPDDLERHLNAQLEQMQIGPIDCYLFHSLDHGRWKLMKEFKALEWAERARADGRIRHIGFSFHDRVESLKEILDEYNGWEFCQIQYNYLDTHFQAGTEGLRYAASKGLGVVVMEPLRGGGLANPPPAIRKLFDRTPVERTPAEWGLRWVWNQPEVSVVLSGMSNLQQVRDNIAGAERSGIGCLSAAESVLFEDVRQGVRRLGWIPCTGCGYCLPCPRSIPIPDYFNSYNAAAFGQTESARRNYAWRKPDIHADVCVQCGECAKRCPQHLPIPELLPKVHETLKPRCTL